MKRPVRILALDTSTNTGWAHDGLLQDCNVPAYGTLRLNGWKPADVSASYATLMAFVRRTVEAIEATHVVIERPLTVYAHSGWKGANARKDPDLANALLGFVAVSEGMAQLCGAKPLLVTPSTVRKHFIGNGAHPEPKLAVMRRCRQLGWRPQDDNAADALACWDYAKSVLDPGWASRTTPLFQEHGHG